MAAETEKPASARNRIVSLPFLLVVVVLGVGGYLGGPWLMTQYFMLVGDKAPVIPSSATTGVDPSMMVMPGMGGGAGGGRRSFDPEAIFARRDADANGILEGEELSGRMAERVAEIDSDGDGAVSKEEFLKGMQDRGNERSRPEDTEADPSAEDSSQAAESDDSVPAGPIPAQAATDPS